MKITRTFSLIIRLVPVNILIMLVGCGVAQVAFEQHREADPGNISVAKTPSYSSDQVAKYNKIIVASRESGGNQLGGVMYGGATEVIGGLLPAITSGALKKKLERN